MQVKNRRRAPVMLLRLASLLTAGAAGGLDSSIVATVPAGDAPPLEECGVDGSGCRLTAKGWWPSECVHSVPSGAAVVALPPGQGVRVTYPNGTVELKPECAAAIPAASLQSLRHRRQQPPENSSGAVPVSSGQMGAYPITWEYGIDPKTAPMNSWSGTYSVGDFPKTGSGGSFWIGLEPYSCDSVMQAVTYFTNDGWFVTSENCCPGGHDFRVGSEKVNASAAGVYPPIQGSVTRLASLQATDTDLAATCTTNASFKMSVCNNAVASVKAPGSDKGTLLPADCAEICESDKFKATIGSCLGWSIVPSTVPAGMRQYQGCYLSNTSWDGKRAACPNALDSSGCSSRGVAKYASSCCGASPTAYVINTTVGGKTFSLTGDNGKEMNIPLTVLEVYNGDYTCSDLPTAVSATGLQGSPATFYGKARDYVSADCKGPAGSCKKCGFTITGDNHSSVATRPKANHPVVHCNPQAQPAETCPGGKPCPTTGICPPTRRG